MMDSGNLPSLWASILVGVAFIPAICKFMEEANYLGVALLGLGALVGLGLLTWAWIRLSDHFWKKK